MTINKANENHVMDKTETRGMKVLKHHVNLQVPLRGHLDYDEHNRIKWQFGDNFMMKLFTILKLILIMNVCYVILIRM